jgi:enediyne biosynthesis protein E4
MKTTNEGTPPTADAALAPRNSPRSDTPRPAFPLLVVRVTQILLKLLVLGIVAPVSPAQAQPILTKITTGALVTDRNYNMCSSWGDFDNDGDLDVFVAARYTQSAAGPNQFYRNNGDGSFTRLTTNDAGDIAEDPTRSGMGLWLDYDRDGDLDFFLNGPYGTKLYRNNDDGSFTSGWAAGFSTSRLTIALAAGDYDNDGWIDLFSATAYPRTSSLATLLHNDGNGAFSDVGIPWRNGWEQFASWCDYDADGDLDLAVGSYNPAGIDQYAFDCIYTNNGAGAFAPLLTVERVGGGRPAWADYDNDGDMDLLVGGNPMVSLRNDTLPDGSHQLKHITNGPLVNSAWGDCICPSWGDYDNDGWLDVFITRGFNNGNPGLLFHSNGDGSFTRVTNETEINGSMHSFGCAWVDYNNDGFLDLFVCNANNESNCLFRNNANANHWLMLQLKGTKSNTDAVGVKVRVQARIGGKTFWQRREITDLLEDRRPHFGLGDATVADVVRIEWPSGTVQELRDVSANRILTVIEPVRLEATGPGRFHFRTWRGHVLTVETSSDLTTWNSIATVTNLSGAVEFTDPSTAVSPQRFYRVLQP